MKITKVYINQENEGEIICPSCDKTRAVNISNQRVPLRPIKVKCTCGDSFSILLEYRKYHRKRVNIPGRLLDTISHAEVGEIWVTSLSVTGIGFEVTTPHEFGVNDVFEIQFTLDDDYDAVISEEIVLKRIDGNYVGAIFSDQNKYNYNLDFYITSQFAVP